MKTALVLLASATLILASTSCDKHSWSQTQSLHEGMHKDHHGDDHAAPHAKEETHAPAAKH